MPIRTLVARLLMLYESQRCWFRSGCYYNRNWCGHHLVYGDTASGAITTIEATTTKILDFAVGTDILQVSTNAAHYSGSNAFVDAAVTAAGATIFVTVATATGTNVAVNAAMDLLVFSTAVAPAVGGGLQAAFNTAIGTNTITGVTANEDSFFTLYDSTNAQMVLGIVNSAGGGATTAIETADVVTLVATLDMTAAEYAGFTNADFQIV